MALGVAGSLAERVRVRTETHGNAAPDTPAVAADAAVPAGSSGHLPPAAAPTTVTVRLIASTTGGAAGQAACSRSLRSWVRVLPPRERTRPRVRSLDTPVTEDPPPTLGDRGDPRVSVAVVINDAT
jgi:hypothetical protein